jgi:hypothetical protein
MDIDDSDEGQVDTWSGGITGSVPQTTTEAPEDDDHKESLHFFPNNQQVIVRLIKNRNKFQPSYHSIKRFFFNLDAFPRRTPSAKQSSTQAPS